MLFQGKCDPDALIPPLWTYRRSELWPSRCGDHCRPAARPAGACPGSWSVVSVVDRFQSLASVGCFGVHTETRHLDTHTHTRARTRTRHHPTHLTPRTSPSKVVELSDVCSMATDVSAGACCASLADLGVSVRLRTPKSGCW